MGSRPHINVAFDDVGCQLQCLQHTRWPFFHIVSTKSCIEVDAQAIHVLSRALF